MRYNRGDFQFTEAQMRRLLGTLVPGLIWNKMRYGRYLDVFLTHAPPEGIHDLADPCHRGFHCFRTFLERFKPALHVHGHIHRYGSDAPRATPCGPTTVINAYDHYTLDFTPPDSKKGIAHE
jgi:Icc-related predicted phosphoesterase